MTARYVAGQKVRVIARMEKRHHRIPAYAKGHCGTVTTVLREEGQPELLAYSDDGAPRQMVYRVRFLRRDFWPADEPASSRDTIDLEVFENWLEPVDVPVGED